MQYSEKELKTIQQCQLIILKKVSEICDKHNLNYVLAAGTAIGAIRHKGFIPWDDDIDIVMLQSDYDRFLEIAQVELGDDYFLQTYETDSNYTMIPAKVRVNSVKFVEDYMKKIDMNHGIYIDVFPFYNLPDDETERKQIIKKCKRLNSLYLLKSCPYTNEMDVPRWKYLIKQTIKSFVSNIILFPVSKKRLYNKIYKLNRKYSTTTTSHFGSIEDDKFCATYDEIFPIQKMEFEGELFSCYHDIDACLTRHYGDYMQLPPVEKRVNHKPFYVDYDAAKVFIEKNQ